MRPITSLLTCALIFALLGSVGCSPDARLAAQRQRSQERIAELDGEIQTLSDDNARLQSELTGQEELAKDIKQESELQHAKFKELLAEHNRLIEQVGRAEPLPAELNAMLAAFAEANSELLSYDSSKGLVSLKSDVSFTAGSDQVKPHTKPVLTALAQICSAELAQNCQVLIVGHTDDQPIIHSNANHPTNWHLSVHRAIAVMDVLKESMPQDRLAVMGFGQYRPIADNLPGNKGNPLNRRVEIFIVPKDMEVPSAGLK